MTWTEAVFDYCEYGSPPPEVPAGGWFLTMDASPRVTEATLTCRRCGQADPYTGEIASPCGCGSIAFAVTLPV